MDSGKVRFVYRHFIVIGTESVFAAMGTECAAEQDKFWEYHDAIFDDWANGRQNGFRMAWLQDVAGDIGIDATEFEECIQSGRAFERVRASQIDGMGRGINSTPSVFVNGIRVGGDNYEEYRSAIEDALEESNQ